MAEFLSNDPLRPLLSLYDQKSLALADKLVAKRTAHEPSTMLTDPDATAARERLTNPAEQSGLIDIAQSSVYQGLERLFDAAHGRTRTAKEIQELGDSVRGVTDDARKRLVTDPQQEVIESLAQGNYLDAAVGSLKAAPGTLADSANAPLEIAAGAVATAIAPNIGGLILGKKLLQGKEAIESVGKKVKKARTRMELVKEAAKTFPKTAGQMSVVTADITQSQISEIVEETGERPSAGKIAQMYGINMLTMTAEGGIIKNFFIPDFKKEFVKEAKIVFKNLGSGSNLGQIGRRVGEGLKKALTAGGAEAAQEYAQTWAEIINVGIGENESFMDGLKREIENEDNQLQALAGAFLGGGAGFTARGAVAAPAVAGGATLDTAKGTAKVAAKTAIGTTKLAAKGVKRVVDAGAYKVLSQSERDVILSEHASRKEIVDNRVAELETSINKVKAATTLDKLRENPEIRKVVDAAIGDQDPSNFDTRRKIEGLKADIISAYRGDIGLLKTELSLRTGANFTRKVGQNVGTAAKSATVATMEAIDPGVQAVVDSVEKYGPKAIQAVEELRSSTARGMIEIAFNAGVAETKSILEAAKSLDLDDLQRTMAAISEFNPKLAQQLKTVSEKKKRALKGAGSIINKVVNVENLSKAITKAAELTNITADKVASISSSVNTALASTIEDIESLEKIEAVVDLIEKTDEFKKGIKGAMSRDAMVVARRNLEKARTRLEKEAAKAGRSTGEKVVDTAAAVAAKAKPVVDKAVDSVRTKLDNVQESLEKSAKDKARDSFKVSPTFTAVMEAVIDTLKDPKKADALVDSAPDLVKQMRKAGIETRADFEVFVEEFPEININMEFYDQLTAAYPTNIALDEAVDVFQNKLVNTAKAIKDAYNRINPPECKV